MQSYQDWLKAKGYKDSAAIRAQYAQYAATAPKEGAPQDLSKLKSLPVTSQYDLSGRPVGGKPVDTDKPPTPIETYQEWVERTGRTYGPGSAKDYAATLQGIKNSQMAAGHLLSGIEENKAPPVAAVPPAAVAVPPVVAPKAPALAPVEIEPKAIPDMAATPPVPEYTGDGNPNDPGAKIEPDFWSKVTKLAGDSGKGLAGLLSSVLAGYNAAAQGKTLDYMKDTAPGREQGKKEQEAREVSNFQRQLAYLDAQQSYQQKQAQIDREYQTALTAAKTQAEKDAADALYARQSQLNKEDNANRLQVAMIGAGRAPGLAATGDPVGLGAIPVKAK